MDISDKLIRRNKRVIKQTPDNHQEIKQLKVRHQPAPVQERMLHYTKENPNHTVADYYRAFPEQDQGYIRKCVRLMVERHALRQRFTID